MTKIYNLIAVWKNDDGELQATRVAEGTSDKLSCKLDACPQGTIRIALMEKKKFDRLVQEVRSRGVDPLLSHKKAN